MDLRPGCSFGDHFFNIGVQKLVRGGDAFGRKAVAADAYVRGVIVGEFFQADIQAVFGGIDSLKLRSSMTLFFRASGEEIFKRVIDRFYGGAEDPATLRILAEDER